MPKALKAHPGERLDLPDYVLGANSYTQDTQKFLLEREVLDRRARVLDGFRIRVEDQALNPGLITVFNGNGLDRSGQLINNEDLPNDSRSVTLLGANLNFYVEIEFVEVTSDTDARYFWDPTIPNTPPEPDGSEFGLNVTTRITPDWRVVTPVSTTGFQQSTNPNSVRVPVGVFRTNGANQITTGVTNPGLSFVRAASVLEADVPIGAVDLRVIDTRIFPATTPFNVTVDFGGASPEARIVSAVDRDNGILTLSVATAVAHQAGAIVRVTSGTADLSQERVDPSDPALDPLLAIPGHPDPAQRLWQANELRGSGLMQSKETFGARDDLNLRSLKDQIDFLSAQLRELKFGHPRPDVVSQAPPATFAVRPRYFDRAGSVQGARSNTCSIGNGSTTFGDFNGTTEAAFIAAVNALPAAGGTIFVKGGTYTFASTVAVGKQVVLVGDSFSAVNIVNNVPAGAAFNVSVSSEFRNVTLSKAVGGLAVAVDISGAVTVSFDRCAVNTGVRVNTANGAIRAFKTSFAPSTAVACISSTGGAVLSFSSFKDCSFVSSLTAFSCPMNTVDVDNCFIFVAIGFLAAGATDVISHLNVTKSNITVVSSLFASVGTQLVTDVRFAFCFITVTGLVPDGAVFLFGSTSDLVNFTARDNYIQVTGVGAVTELAPGAIVRTDAAGVTQNVCVVRNNIEAPAGAYVVGLRSDCFATTLPTYFVGNVGYRLAELVRLGSAANQMISGEYVITDNTHNNGSASAIAYGVRFYLTPAASFVSIKRNTFANYNNAGAGARIGVDATWDTINGVDVDVVDNIFAFFTGTTTTAGVFFGNIATAPTFGAVRVYSNKMYSLLGTGTVSAGVYADPSNVGNTIEFDIDHNSMFTIGATVGGSAEAYGVRLDTVSRGSVNNNEILLVASGNVAGQGVSVSLVNCGNAGGVVASGNRLFRAASAAAAPLSLAGALIKLTGTCANIVVSDNVCSQLGETGTLAVAHIMLFTDQCRGIKINDNRIVSSATGGVHGILVSRDVSTGAIIEDIQVCDNSIEMNASGAWTGITALLGGNSSGMEIHDNQIRETTLAGTHAGINVRGHDNPVQTRSVSICNNVLNGVKVGAIVAGREGISVLDCRMVSVQDNLIDWMEPLVADGFSILITTILGGVWRQFNVVGNNIRPSGGVGSGLIITTASMQDGQAHSNILGDAVTPGLITPALAAGGWTYGAAGLANFNKLT